MMNDSMTLSAMSALNSAMEVRGIKRLSLQFGPDGRSRGVRLIMERGSDAELMPTDARMTPLVSLVMAAWKTPLRREEEEAVARVVAGMDWEIVVTHCAGYLEILTFAAAPVESATVH